MTFVENAETGQFLFLEILFSPIFSDRLAYYLNYELKILVTYITICCNIKFIFDIN
jgi:hypothetical protein